jgi:replicative DNA helicase
MTDHFDDFRDPDGDARVAQLRVPPHSIEAESSVLGGLLLDGGAWDRVGDLLVEEDFYRFEHRLIFSAIGVLANSARPADVVSVFVHLQNLGKAEEAGGLTYLNSLAQYVPSAANIRRYAEIVRERSVLRRLVAASDEIATAALSPQGRSVATILDDAERSICGIAEQRATPDEWEGLDTGMIRLLDRIQERADGTAAPDYTPTGLDDLDSRLDGGMRDGELIIIGARPAMGKSALAITIAQNVALKHGLPVAVFTMEMPRPQLNTRLLAMRSRIHLGILRRPERLRDLHWTQLTAAVEELRGAPIHINDESGLNINQIRSKTRALRRRVGRVGLVVVDYLGLMSGLDPKAPRAYQLEEITKGLKSLAKELQCPVICLAQINRVVETRTDRMPQLSDLRDSGAIEQDADIVIFLHREIVVQPDLTDDWAYYAKGFVAKLRDGQPGYFDLMYVGENVRFDNWPAGTPAPSSKVRVSRETRSATAKEI